MTTLLVLIYIAFISLGIPDALLGAAWPAMHADIGVPVSLAGIISIVIAGGTVLSSLMSARWAARFGTGRVTAFSVMATAIALLGFSFSNSMVLLLLFAIPLGLGAGAVDAVLNNFVALHYQAKQMNWLHSFWGIGATIGPAFMGALLSATGNWRSGYLGMAGLQAVLVAVLFLSLPLWKRAAEKAEAEQETPARVLSLRETLRQPLAKPVLFAFLCYCGAESIMGLWGASYLVSARGIAPDTAAVWVSAFCGGITVGRFAAGLLTDKWNNQQMIRIGERCAFAGIALFFIPEPNWVLLIAFFMVGLGFAPIFPALLHQTPRTFGSEASQSMIGVQMASAYIGTTCIPPLFGLMSSKWGFELLPIVLAMLVLLMTLCTAYVREKTQEVSSK